MKPGIHPEYHQVEATCVCGNVILTGSTSNVLKMEICNACHPFYTGTQKIVDTEGRVEKFKKRYTQAETARKAAKSKDSQPEQQQEEKQEKQEPQNQQQEEAQPEAAAPEEQAPETEPAAENE